MARIRDEIVRVENLGPGLRCLVTPGVGKTWLDFHIELTNITLAQATNIKLLLISPTKTVTLQEFKDGDELKDYNDYFGRKTDSAKLSFYFRKPEMETEAQSMAFALGTGGLQDLRVEFTVDAGVTSPGVQAWGRKVANRSVAAGLLPYVVNHNVGGSAEGTVHYDAIEKRDRISSIHVLNDKVDHCLLKVDDAIAYNLSRARGDFDAGAGGRTPYGSTKGMVIDFTTAGVIDEALVMQAPNYQVQQMRLSTTLGASPAAVVRYLVEYVSTWPSLAGGNSQRAA